MKKYLRLVLLLFGLGSNFLISYFASAGEAKPAWQTEWEKTLAAAKKEGQLTLYAQSAANYEIVFQEFQKRYPEIKIKMVEEPERRVMAERRAGKFLGDLYLGGIVTPTFQFYRGKVLEPIKPILLLPEVVDQSKWWGGKHHYADPEDRYIFVFQGDVRGGQVAYNVNSINPKEFRSYWDFLHPRLRGKIVVVDPALRAGVSNGLRFLYHNPELGPEFIKRLFSEMNLTLTRDTRQFIDWLAVGKFSIGFLVSAGLEEAIQQGLPVGKFDPNGFKEGASVGPSAGAMAMFDKAPHPSAARVAINWLLSREGQTAYQRIFATSQVNSMREDIPKDTVDFQRIKGVKYRYMGTMEDAEVIKETVRDALAVARKK